MCADTDLRHVALPIRGPAGIRVRPSLMHPPATGPATATLQPYPGGLLEISESPEP